MEYLIRLLEQLFDSVNDARDVVDELSLPKGIKRRQMVLNRKKGEVKGNYIAHVTAAEFDLQQTRVQRLLVSAWGFGRVTNSRYRAIRSCT